MTERPKKELRVSPCNLTFTEDNVCRIHHPHNDSLVVTMTVANHKVYRILVDTESSADIIYLEAFERMGIPRSRLRPVKTPLHGFARERVISEGAISLLKCYAIAVRKRSGKQALTINVLNPRGPTEDSSVEDSEVVPLNEEDPSKTVQLGMSLNSEQRFEMLAFLQQQRDIFTWSYEDMPGMSPDVMVHRLNVDSDYRPVKQKRRAFDAKRYAAIANEVSKLLSVGFIEEVHYLDWIANVVLVKKANRKWWVCVNYSDLNKAYPKDSFPLPQIDQLVDSTTGHELLSFLDAYFGYN
ncbi:uncharacterized protein LOC131218114 [Magnolia sinica]|uniref:uncharacterized protein LOC131218114 n=1 Tax=Magnolia sinica TaxID=86752 RepID=UPI002659A222|nr:uncharacterized protein LOC131218114 [Magnolia sinica]